MPVTAAAKEYLLAIYELAQEGRPVIGARVAERLHVTAPTVHQMLKRLQEDGLIVVDGRSLALSGAGRSIAEAVLQRQNLSERWLVEMLDLDWAEARLAARAMEAAISPRIAERLATSLGHPIERAAEAVASDAAWSVSSLLPLDAIEAGAVVVLERIAEEEEHAQELVAYLERHGLRPGARLTVVAVEPGAGTLTLECGGERVVLGSRVAGHLWVRRLGAAELARLLTPQPSECPDEANAFVAEVEAVQNDCPAGHRLGDRFVFGQRTPCGMCADAFVEVYPHLEGLRQRALVERGASVAVPCPEHGNVTFRVRPTHGATAEAIP